MNSFQNRVVLITGAGSGIGREFARRLAAEGARIAALDRQAEGLDALAADLKGKPLACAVADVTDLAGVRAAAARMEEGLGPTDVLIASAGIGRETSALDFRAEDFADLVQVNLIGVANCIDAVLPGMRRRRQGHLVALSSLASYRGLPLMGGYCASKAGVNALLDALRVELKPLGIAVTTLCPCWVRTPMTAAVNVPGANMMEVGEAVRRMLAAVRARRPFLAFPARDAWQVRLLRYLPRPAGDWLAARLLRRVTQK
jgi:NAD(P)-dependent dehydrogenase (short-subunit alcohol dehydrogenase family)